MKLISCPVTGCPSLQFKNDAILIRSRLRDRVYQLVFVLALIQSVALVREGSCFSFTLITAIIFGCIFIAVV